MTPTIATPPALQNWETRVQITWIAPLPEEYTNDLTRDPDLRPPPRSNLVASIVTTPLKTAEAAAAEFWEQTSEQLGGIERQRAEPLVFADGTVGFMLIVVLYASQDIKLRQTHMFRIDGTLLTQFVVTVDEATGEGEEHLVAIAQGLNPMF